MSKVIEKKQVCRHSLCMDETGSSPDVNPTRCKTFFGCTPTWWTAASTHAAMTLRARLSLERRYVLAFVWTRGVSPNVFATLTGAMCIELHRQVLEAFRASGRTVCRA